jgi:hypothetical protein
MSSLRSYPRHPVRGEVRARSVSSRQGLPDLTDRHSLGEILHALEHGLEGLLGKTIVCSWKYNLNGIAASRMFDDATAAQSQTRDLSPSSNNRGW